MNNGEIKFVFCTQCGTKNDINANFCTSCGNKLSKPTPPPEPVVVAEEPKKQEDIPAELPVTEEQVIEESVAKDPIIEEPTPVAEEPVIEEPAPVAEEPVIEEPTPVVEEPVIEEPDPVVEEPIIEEPTPVVEEPVIEEPAVVVAAAQKPAKEEQITYAAPVSAPAAEPEAKKISENSHYYYNSSAANTAVNIPQPAPEKPKKKKKQNFFLKFLSFLLSLVLIASLVLAVPITLLNMFLTDHNIAIIVDRAVSSIELDKLEFSTADGTQTLSSALLGITDEFEGWDHITEEQINDALLEDFVKQFVTDALAQLGMSLKDGEAMLGWTPEQIYDFIEANKDTIEKLAREAGYEGKLPIEEKKEMMIENIENRIGKDGISVSALFGDSDETAELMRYLDTAQALFSINTLFLAWGLVAFVVVLIIFTNLGYFGAFCRACGFPAFIVGAIYFLAGMGVSPLLSIIDMPVPMLSPVIEFTAGFLGALLMDISVIVLGVGLVLVIISFISDAIRRKIDSKNNA